MERGSHKDENPVKPHKATPPPKSTLPAPLRDYEIDPDDLMLIMPLPRYNAMLAVLCNSLYMTSSRRARASTCSTIQEEKDSLRSQATVFIGAPKDATRSHEDVYSTSLPGETFAMFYPRSREYWAGKVFRTRDIGCKMRCRDGFTLAEERYAEYQPILEEVERILAEAGLDEEVYSPR